MTNSREVEFTYRWTDPKTDTTHRAGDKARLPDLQARRLIHLGRAREIQPAQESTDVAAGGLVEAVEVTDTPITADLPDGAATEADPIDEAADEQEPATAKTARRATGKTTKAPVREPSKEEN